MSLPPLLKRAFSLRRSSPEEPPPSSSSPDDSSDSHSHPSDVTSPSSRSVAPPPSLSSEKSLEQQTLASLSSSMDNIWSALRNGNLSAVQFLIERNTGLVYTRGPVGELPIHLCFLYNSENHKIIGRYMLDQFPSLILEQYTGVEYYGENVLHIAIIQQDEGLVRELLDREPRLLMQRATGKFFQLDSSCPYGEYPLHFAAATNQFSLVKLLLQYCKLSHLSCVDSHQNNILHLLVQHKRSKMYYFIKQCYIKMREKERKEEVERRREEKEKRKRERKHNGNDDEDDDDDDDEDIDPSLLPLSDPLSTGLWTQLNGDGFTPFTLSSNDGNDHMFSFLLEEQKLIQWSYGPVTCVLYPLDQLDIPLYSHEKFNETEGKEVKSALELIVQHGHLELLMHPHIVNLLDYKWKRFASQIFVRRFIFTLLFLTIFTYSVIFHPLQELHEHEKEDMAMRQMGGKYQTKFNNQNNNETIFPTMTTMDDSQVVGDITDNMASLSASFSAFDSIASSTLSSHSDSSSASPSPSPPTPSDVISVAASHLHSSHHHHHSHSSGLHGHGHEFHAGESIDNLVLSLESSLSSEKALYTSDLIVLFGTIYKSIIEYKQMRRRGIVNYLYSSGSAMMENIFSILFIFLLLLSLILKYSIFHWLTNVISFLPILSISCIVGWIYLLFYLLAFRLTGPMVIMIYSMLKQDVARFLLIFSVFLMAFSQAFYVLLYQQYEHSFTHNIYLSALIMVGEFDMNIYTNNDTAPILSVILFILYIIIIAILLLNLLIAMMGDTYTKIDAESDQIWHLERARIILEIELEMSDGSRKEKDRKYWTEVTGRRFIQMQQVNENHFRNNGKEKEKEKEKENENKGEKEKEKEEKSAN